MKQQHRAAGDSPASDAAPADETEEKAEHLQYSLLPAWLVPVPFGNPLVILVLALGLLGVAYPIAQAWLKAVSYYDAPAVRSFVAPTETFPNFTLVLCPAASSVNDLTTSTAKHLAVYATSFDNPNSTAASTPSVSFNQGGNTGNTFNFSMYTLPSINATSCTIRDAIAAQVSGMAAMMASTSGSSNQPSFTSPPMPPVPPGTTGGSVLPHTAPPAPGSGPHNFPPVPTNMAPSNVPGPTPYSAAPPAPGGGQHTAPPMPANMPPSNVPGPTPSSAAPPAPTHLPSGWPPAPHMPANMGGRRRLAQQMPSPQQTPPPVWFNGTSGAGQTASCGNVEFAPLTAELTTAGRYGKEKVIKYMTFSLQACGGPEILVSDASGTVVATINGAAFDNPTVHSPCQADAFGGYDTVVNVDLSTPVPLNADTAYIGSSTDDDYAWTSGYTIRVGCFRNNRCQVSGSVTLTTMVRPFSYDTIFSGMPASSTVRVARPAGESIVFGPAINSSECWEVTPSLPFRKSDLSGNHDNDPGFTVLAGGDGAALAFGFYPAGDPDGLQKLISQGSGFKFIPSDSSAYFYVRLRAEVTRTLLPHELNIDVGQVLGIQDASTGGAQPDPWPPTADDLSQFTVSLAFDAAADVFQQGQARQQCPSPKNSIDHSRSCSTLAYSQLILTPELLSYDVDVLEEFYPFDDSDAVQTLFTYLPLVPQFVLPLCMGLPLLFTSLARRWPGVCGRALAFFK